MSETSPEKPGTNPSPLELAAGIVAAYVSKNAVTAVDLPALIADVYKNISKIATGTVEPPPAPPLEPAVPIKKSITAEFIVCLEDGKKFRSLKRHLNTAYGLTPQDYRKKWGLPQDYPMVAPAYSAARSELAKQMGLGSQRKQTLKPPKKKSTSKAA